MEAQLGSGALHGAVDAGYTPRSLEHAFPGVHQMPPLSILLFIVLKAAVDLAMEIWLHQGAK
jgi:hypothetical protein